MFATLTVLVVLLWILTLAAMAHESAVARGFGSELRRIWRRMGVPARLFAIVAVVFFTQSGGSKGVAPVTKMMRLMFWTPGSPWHLMEADADVRTAAAAVAAASNTFERVEQAVTNADVWTISYGWHAPNRLPYHARQNVLGYNPWVTRTNINGVAYEDHHVAFNAVASTNPAVILIEYARKLDSGEIERVSSPVVTSSCPATATISLQSGAHTCYWFRCAVPIAFTNAVRDWNGEALFGSPEGSGTGFELLGTLVVDDGNDVWIGSNTNLVFGVQTQIVRNGIITED